MKVFLFILPLLFYCTPKKQSQTNSTQNSSIGKKEQDGSESSLKSTSFLYEGNLPCQKNCKLNEKIVFSEDGRFVLTKEHRLAESAPALEIKKGKWTQMSDSYILNSPNLSNQAYLIKSDSVLVKIEAEKGTTSTKAPPTSYTLKKQTLLKAKDFNGAYFNPKQIKDQGPRIINIQNFNDTLVEVVFNKSTQMTHGCILKAKASFVNNQIIVNFKDFNKRAKSSLVLTPIKIKDGVVISFTARIFGEEDEDFIWSKICNDGGKVSGTFTRQF